MLYSKLLCPTLKETPSEAEVVSHQLMLRAGMIRQLAAGIYDFLPVGLKVVRNIESIVREEMNRAGAQEVLLPAVHPSELWIESGRWKTAGAELLRFKDRNERSYCFGPTHEEVITDLVRREIRSYRELPKTFYQIQVKFRDEVRPRFGLMRGREFIMKDAYSFDVDDAALDESYRRMYDAYVRIFERCNLKFRVVDADTGNIGGKASQEFMVIAKSGEDELIICTSCHYAANLEKAVSKTEDFDQASSTSGARKEIHTPSTTSIDDVAALLKKSPNDLLKVLFYEYDEQQLCAVILTGDRDVNEIKLKRLLGANDLSLTSAETVEKICGTPVGYCGPMGLEAGKAGLHRVIIDSRVLAGKAYVAGANKKDYHVENIVLGRDFSASETVDIHKVRAGDICVKCSSALEVERGIEVGHVFKLGIKYSESMGANYTDEAGKLIPIVMGCYGIGVTRIAAATIEQNHDESGIVFPVSLAPFQVSLILTDTKDAALRKQADELYNQLLSENIDVLYDERETSPGVKFKDSDLLGIPMRIVVGKKSMEQQKVEAKIRWQPKTETILISPAEVLPWVKQGLSLRLR